MGSLSPVTAKKQKKKLLPKCNNGLLDIYLKLPAADKHEAPERPSAQWAMRHVSNIYIYNNAMHYYVKINVITFNEHSFHKNGQGWARSKTPAGQLRHSGTGNICVQYFFFFCLMQFSVLIDEWIWLWLWLTKMNSKKIELEPDVR